MKTLNRSIPLAFLLAMASETSGVSFGATNDAPPVLTHGMLAELLAGSTKSPAAEPDGQQAPNSKVAQFFRNYGFFNCFGGNWRNC
jgi:hypothetical protein